MSSAALRPAVLFDRDGTLNVDHGYTHKPADLVFTPGAPAAIAALNARGVLAVVITNQAGVARGYYDESAVSVFHDHMQAELAKHAGRIDAFYYCPYHEDAVIERYRAANHPDRKPNPGMLLRAIAELRIDAARALMIGDQETDMAAGRAAGIRGVLYDHGTDIAALVSRETANW
jgi:D-glycero-D-manno-heptose 1,7-bisphosphate phosphatase